MRTYSRIVRQSHRYLPFHAMLTDSSRSARCNHIIANLHWIHPELSQLKLEQQVKKQPSLVLGTTSSQPAESHVSTVNKFNLAAASTKAQATLYNFQSCSAPFLARHSACCTYSTDIEHMQRTTRLASCNNTWSYLQTKPDFKPGFMSQQPHTWLCLQTKQPTAHSLWL